MENTNDNDGSIVHQIPASLQHLKDALPAALFYLGRGERPTTIPGGESKSTRFPFNAIDAHRSKRLEPEFGSRTKVIIAALAWTAEQPEFVQHMLKNTKPY